MLNNLNFKKISLWLFVTILACFAIATLLFFQIDIKDFKDNKYQYDVNEEKYFATGEIKDINIDSFLSDINIIESDDTKVKVHIYGKLYSKKKTEETPPVIELVEGTLNIKENRKSSISIGINFNIGELFQRDEMKIDLFVPKGYSENIKIDSSSGNVKADPLSLKEFDIKTFSGDIELKDVTADTANFETSSGNINVANIQAIDIKINSFSGNNDFKSINADKVYIENSSGNISLGTVEAGKIAGATFSGNITADVIKVDDVEMSTSSGRIRIEGATIKKIKCETFSGNITFNNASLNDSDIDATSGNVTITLIEGSEFALEANSSSGNVACDFPINITEKQGKHEIKGVVGKATNKMKINTFSGNINISKSENLRMKFLRRFFAKFI
ncbi:MAG TPA: DUF4097 family beta strand repeat-containing protein [Ruminiclostridium sp.]